MAPVSTFQIADFSTSPERHVIFLVNLEGSSWTCKLKSTAKQTHCLWDKV